MTPDHHALRFTKGNGRVVARGRARRDDEQATLAPLRTGVSYELECRRLPAPDTENKMEAAIRYEGYILNGKTGNPKITKWVPKPRALTGVERENNALVLYRGAGFDDVLRHTLDRLYYIPVCPTGVVQDTNTEHKCVGTEWVRQINDFNQPVGVEYVSFPPGSQTTQPGSGTSSNKVGGRMKKMTRALSIALMTLAVFTGTRGYAADIASVAWTESNLDVLRTFGKAAVEDFVNTMGDDGMHATVGEFAWIDLAGDKRYELVTRLDLSGRAYFDYLVVYWRSPAGKVTRDWIEGVEGPSLDKIVRDLDGDGKDELIVPSALDEHDPRGYPGYPARVWPKVYELRNGHYVDGSRKFAKFYDEEVLPELESRIDQARDAAARDSEAHVPQRQLAVAQMTRDKILHLLGRPSGR